MDFSEYYKLLGLNSYPFSIFTAEKEKEKSESLYKKPGNHSVILEGLQSSSVLVTGERGTGKTALALDIERQFKDGSALIVKIDEFSKLKSGYNAEELYDFLTKSISSAFFEAMAETPNFLWKYSKDDRLELSLFLHQYVTSSSKKQLSEKIKTIQNGFFKRGSLAVYNVTRGVLNYGLKAFTKVVSDSLTKHFSALPEIDMGDSEYFKKIEAEIDDSFTLEDRAYFYLSKICDLIKKSKFKKIIVIIDKIDEDTRFKNDATLIANYIEGFASDNKLMVSEKFNALLFLWTTPFNQIKQNIRTQKITLQPLSWNLESLKLAADKRIQAFSDNKISNIESIFEDSSKDQLTKLLEMSNNNPRDLWHLLDECLKSQFDNDCSKKITKEAIDNGINSFVRNFNYYEYYPKKANAKSNSMDIYSYIKHLLKLDKEIFTKDRFNQLAGTGSSTNNYVSAMENMGLIQRTEEKSKGGGVLYEIKDPKVKYALKNDIEIRK